MLPMSEGAEPLSAGYLPEGPILLQSAEIEGWVPQANSVAEAVRWR